jgi:hypothetical protein
MLAALSTAALPCPVTLCCAALRGVVIVMLYSHLLAALRHNLVGVCC